jgi:hypothetical protein
MSSCPHPVLRDQAREPATLVADVKQQKPLTPIAEVGGCARCQPILFSAS